MSLTKLKHKCNKWVAGMHFEEQFKTGLVYGVTDTNNKTEENWAMINETRKQKRFRKRKHGKLKYN